MSPAIVGYVDLIEIREQNSKKLLSLVDFKTAARKPAEEDSNPDQLLLYALAAKHSGFQKEFGLPLELRYDYFTKTKNPEAISVVVEATPEATERVIEKSRRCWKGMKADICFPCPGWMCSGCGHQARCKAWPQAID